jgi:hypothetical protein
MIKQYYITHENMVKDSPDDCYLAPEDPIHGLKVVSYMGGLNATERLHEYNASVQESNRVKSGAVDKAKFMKENGIKPGTPAWFELWYGRNK